MPAIPDLRNSHLLTFERDVLTAVRSVLPDSVISQFDGQVRAINRVQRLLQWREIEFYRMEWLRVRWPESLLFGFREERLLATVHGSFGQRPVVFAVWAVGGHVFSLEASVELKPIHKMAPFSISEVKPFTAV